MTESTMLSSTELIAHARLVRADTLFAFNLDGILLQNVAELPASPVSEQVRAALQSLMDFVRVIVLSGKSRKDALAGLGFEPYLLISDQGKGRPSQEGSRNWQHVKYCLKWREQLYDILSDVRWLEIKFLGESVSLHYEKTDSPAYALSRINAAIETLEPPPRRVDSHCVVNLLPNEANTKEDALVAAMNRFGSVQALFFDETVSAEENVRLRKRGVFCLTIGNSNQTAQSDRSNRLADILTLLNAILAILRERR